MTQSNHRDHHDNREDIGSVQNKPMRVLWLCWIFKNGPLATLAAVLLAAFATTASADDVGGGKATAHTTDSSAQKPHVLVVVGPSEHPPGTHEVAATGALIERLLRDSKRIDPPKVSVISEWPDDNALLDTVSSVVFLGDFFPPSRMKEKERILQQLDEMAKRGCGMVCVHFATGLKQQDVTPDGHHPLLDWTGGYFANRCAHHQSVAKIFESNIEPAEHRACRTPACRAGWLEIVSHR